MGNKPASSVCAAVVLLAMLSPGSAQDKQKLLAPTPPMGWNSWDAYGRSINEADVRARMDELMAQAVAQVNAGT